jgi:hypothetical protein
MQKGLLIEFRGRLAFARKAESGRFSNVFPEHITLLAVVLDDYAIQRGHGLDIESGFDCRKSRRPGGAKIGISRLEKISVPITFTGPRARA